MFVISKITGGEKMKTQQNEVNEENTKSSYEDRLKVIGERCLRAREEYDEYNLLSQRKFAKELGINYPRVSLLEQGKAELTLTELHAYQKATGHSYDYFMGRQECKNPDNEEIHQRLGLTEEAINVLEKLNTERNRTIKNKRAFAKRIETINYLLENEATYSIFGFISLFLWDEYEGIIEVLEKNSGTTLHLPASKLNNTLMLDIEKYLNKLKEHTENEKKEKKKNSKKRK